MATGSLCFPFFLDISPFRGMVTGDGYGESLFSSFSWCFSLWAIVTGSMVTGSLWEMVTGDGYGKSLFSFFSSHFSFWEMVTGDGCGRWLREGSLCFPLFLDISPFGGWLREMVTGSLCFPVFLSFSFWGMVAGDGYGKSLGDGYGRWLREVFVFLFFLTFLLSGGWLREMVTGSLCFPFFLDISPCGR